MHEGRKTFDLQRDLIIIFHFFFFSDDYSLNFRLCKNKKKKNNTREPLSCLVVPYKHQQILMKHFLPEIIHAFFCSETF